MPDDTKAHVTEPMDQNVRVLVQMTVSASVLVALLSLSQDAIRQRKETFEREWSGNSLVIDLHRGELQPVFAFG